MTLSPIEQARLKLSDVLPKARYADFFSLVQFLERVLGGETRVGSTRSPDEEFIRFHHDPGLSFSASDITSAVIGPVNQLLDDGGKLEREVVRITSTFLGLAGGVSPLPPYFADEVAREDPFAPHQRAFLDIFHHRLLSLFYRSAARFNVPCEFESTGKDAWTKRVLALGGYDTETPTSDDLPFWQRLQLTPLLATQVRSASSLERSLKLVLRSEIAELSVSIKQFWGGWTRLDNDQRIRLGVANSRLGKTTTLGERIFDPTSRIGITIGPLTQNNYQRFMADGDLFGVIANVIKTFSAEPLDYQLELVLADGATPALCLSSLNPVSFLGKNTWLGHPTGESSRHYVDSEQN